MVVIHRLLTCVLELTFKTVCLRHNPHPIRLECKKPGTSLRVQATTKTSVYLFQALTDVSKRHAKIRTHDLGKGGGRIKESFPSFLHFFFVFVVSQFRGPDYLRAWNRLASS